MIFAQQQDFCKSVAPLTVFTVLISLGLVFLMISNGPILQDPGYHNFADQRKLLGIAYFWNVITNVPYILIGSAGLLYSADFCQTEVSTGLRRAFVVFFFFLILTGLGSGYYHLAPDNDSLFWDRLPLAATFMAFLDIVICKFGSERIGKHLLPPLITLGLSSVLLWKFGKGSAAGDLRMYAAVQFIPMLLIPTFIFNGNTGNTDKKNMMVILICYVLAKVLEISDHHQFMGQLFGGHAFKHLISGYGCFLILRMYQRTFPKQISNTHLPLMKNQDPSQEVSG